MIYHCHCRSRRGWSPLFKRKGSSQSPTVRERRIGLLCLERKDAASRLPSEKEGLNPLFRKEIKGFLSLGREADRLLFRKEKGNLPFLKRKEAVSRLLSQEEGLNPL